MVNFLSHGNSMTDVINYLERRLIYELKREYGDVDCFGWNDLISEPVFTS